MLIFLIVYLNFFSENFAWSSKLSQVLQWIIVAWLLVAIPN
jgi:hypothetical protein